MNDSLTLIIGTPRYSTWSLRPWLMLKMAGIAFQTTEITLRQPDTKEQILKYSPSGKVPLLIDGPLRIWDSLAIGEYLAEKFPQAHLWPQTPEERAWARSVSAEMHSGFQALRSTCPMDIGLDSPLAELSDDLKTDIHRIETIWTACREHHEKAGPFLFGGFTIADAMFAPVVTRFQTYHLPRNTVAQAYMDTILNLSQMQDWINLANC